MEIRDTRNGDWHWVYNALLADKHLTAGEKIVYSSISTFGGHQVIHPTKEQLAERCGMDEKTVQRALKKLEEVGYLSIDYSTGRGNANVYYLLKKPKGCNLCPFIKGDIEDDKGGLKQPERGTETTPHIDKKDIQIDIVKESEKPQRATYAEIVGYASNRVKPILKRCEEIAGTRYPNERVQETNISKCLRAGYSEEQIIACFESLLADEFWGNKGVDLGTVYSQIGKAKKAPEVIKSYGKKHV